jgi:hypothetical protein
VVDFSDEKIKLLLLVEVLLDTPERFWSGTGVLQYDGKSWIGAGKLISISAIKETSNLQANGLKLSLSGIDAIASSQLNFGDFRSKRCNVSLGYSDPDLTNIQSVPIFSGFVDRPVSQDDGRTSSILIEVESELLDFKRVKRRMRTNEDQQLIYAGDRGLEYVLRLQNKDISWGA